MHTCISSAARDQFVSVAINLTTGKVYNTCTYIHMYLTAHDLTFNDPSSNPATATEPFRERAQDRAHGESGGTSD